MYVGAPRGQQASAALPVSDLPAPSDAQVQLSVSGGELVAVHKFEGYITPQAAAAARQKLVEALQKGGAADTTRLVALSLCWPCTVLLAAWLATARGTPGLQQALCCRSAAPVWHSRPCWVVPSAQQLPCSAALHCLLMPVCPCTLH